MPARTLLRFWVPPLLWTGVILAASFDLFSAAHTAPWLADLLRLLVGHPLPEPRFEQMHWIVRKSAHITEYAILSALLFRALRAEQVPRWKAVWVAISIAVCLAVGSLDEWHQSFVPSRGSSPWDVLLDGTGAALAQGMIRTVQVLFFRR